MGACSDLGLVRLGPGVQPIRHRKTQDGQDRARPCPSVSYSGASGYHFVCQRIPMRVSDPAVASFSKKSTSAVILFRALN